MFHVPAERESYVSELGIWGYLETPDWIWQFVRNTFELGDVP